MKQHVKEFIDAYATSVVWTAYVTDDDEEPVVWANNLPTTPAPVQEHLDTLYDYTLEISR